MANTNLNKVVTERRKKRPKTGPYKHPLDRKDKTLHVRMDETTFNIINEYARIARMRPAEFIRDIIKTHLQDEHSFLKLQVLWAKRSLINAEAQLKSFRAERNRPINEGE